MQASMMCSQEARSHYFHWRMVYDPINSKPKSSTTSRSAIAQTPGTSYRVNDDVYIRPKSVKELGISGRITKITDKSDSSSRVRAAESVVVPASRKRKATEDTRVSIRPHCFLSGDFDAEKYCRSKEDVRPSRLFPVFDAAGDDKSSTTVVLTPDTVSYRLLAASHVRVADRVLEIGCSTGECTALVLRRLVLLHQQRMRIEASQDLQFLGGVIAFDTSNEMIDKARRRIGDEYGSLAKTGRFGDIVKLYNCDALMDTKGRAISLASDGGRYPDVVLVDIGGNRELHGVVRMINWVKVSFQRMPPRLIIVKSEALVERLT
ncbi:hypothetical protein THAOC_02922 [Thalassiosira oceanica]|uniref:Methyltransferase domain-containing protein n=1 Tax=Thalassiosira oceanica TaxID=159749 RepID=K0TDX5_THAOC|nr:hypothetical protein THAOC_02922 [Thalassiosira oceanica]|eukprot:EJK75354.1 hypothetical protein THAOC_02922 [Thalassiosira oceanica]